MPKPIFDSNFTGSEFKEIWIFVLEDSRNSVETFSSAEWHRHSLRELIWTATQKMDLGAEARGRTVVGENQEESPELG